MKSATIDLAHLAPNLIMWRGELPMSLAITSYPALPAHYDTRPAGMAIEAVVIHRFTDSLAAALAHLARPTAGLVRCSWHYSIARGW